MLEKNRQKSLEKFQNDVGKIYVMPNSPKPPDLGLPQANYFHQRNQSQDVGGQKLKSKIKHRIEYDDDIQQQYLNNI